MTRQEANDTFYTTGKTYYKACYEKQVAAGGHFAEPRAPDPDKAALWALCAPIALRALRETGMRVDRHAAAARFQGCPDATETYGTK